MADWRMKIIVAEAERLIELAAEDAELRGGLRALARQILAATDDPPTGDEPGRVNATPPVAPASAIAEGSPASEYTPVDPAKAAEPLRELTLGRSPPTWNEAKSRPATISGPDTRGEDIAQIEARCRQKAHAARWAAGRLRRLHQGEDPGPEDAPSDPDIVGWADRLRDCFYWRNALEGLEPADVSSLDDVGGCFQAVAEALALVRGIPDKPRVLEGVLPLIAEAQSALRAAVHHVRAPDDPEQLQVFAWLKATAARHRLYIRRFMRADDSANPIRWPELLVRIEKLGERYGRQTTGRSQQDSLFTPLRVRRDAVRAVGSTESDWRAVIEAVEDLVSAGIPPSNREIREILLPAINELPDFPDFPPGFRLVLREIDRFLATHATTAGASIPHEPTAAVKEVARLLGGRSLVLIGGSRRREAQESLERALRLKELIWIETKEHQAVDAFEPLVARPDVVLVLLAIRWSSHAFGDVKQLCDRHGKPLVRLPGGYNPNQVAAQIVAQCSGQLAQGDS